MSPVRSPDHLALGRAVREVRESRTHHGRPLSQEALAAESGIDRTYIGGIERGERNPSYTNLLRVAAALGLPLSELVARAERR